MFSINRTAYLKHLARAAAEGFKPLTLRQFAAFLIIHF